MSDPQVVVVIPSRYAATRLPGKPLVNLAGKPMVQRDTTRGARGQAMPSTVSRRQDGGSYRPANGWRLVGET